VSFWLTLIGSMNWMTFKKLLIVINASPKTAVYCKELLAKLQLS